MQFFRLECKRMFTNKRFMISCFIVFLLLLCGAYDMFLPGYDIVEAMIFSLGANATAILALFFTIMGSVPWAVSFFEERESGYQKYLQSKVGTMKYLVSKYCSNIICGHFTSRICFICYLSSNERCKCRFKPLYGSLLYAGGCPATSCFVLFFTYAGNSTGCFGV